jgi:hypothetical protein
LFAAGAGVAFPQMDTLPPMQGPQLPYSRSIEDIAGIGDIEYGEILNDQTVDQAEPYTSVADLFGLGPAIAAIPNTPADRDITPLPMDTGTPLTIPEEGIETLLPPAATSRDDDEGGGAGGGGGAAAPAVDDAFEQDKWLALAQAGLSLMASKQPTLGGAIGEAGLAGITALRTARSERDKRIEAQQARADRLAAAARTRAPGYEDDAVGDLLTQRARLFEEASSYYDSELQSIRPGYEARYNRLIQQIDAIDSIVGAATMSRFPGLMEALTEE